MKKIFKQLFLAFIVALGFTLVACSGGEANSTNSQESTESNGTESGSEGGNESSTETEAESDPIPEGMVRYEVYVKTEAGKPISGLIVELFLGDEFMDGGTTNKKGYVKFDIEPAVYEIRVDATVKPGYYLDDNAKMTTEESAVFEFKCSTFVIEGEAPKDLTYTLGDIIYDFTLTDFDGNTLNLIETLKTKKVVYINFWYSSCGPCVRELPVIQKAYESTSKNGTPYSDDVCFIALNPADNLGPSGQADSPEFIRDYKKTNGYTYDFYPDYNRNSSGSFLAGLRSLFGIVATPTTVVIDRYGNIAEISQGEVPQVVKWTSSFEKYIADDYTPHYKGEGGEDEAEKVVPNITQPDSNKLLGVVAGTNYDNTKFNTTFKPEQNSEDAKYSWPFTISTNGDAMVPGNTGVDNSFAMVHFNVHLEKNEVFTFDYFASTETQADTLYILVDGNIVTNISGISLATEQCYAFPAVYSGDYKITFIYQKDSDAQDGDDTVYLKNFRILKSESIEKETYIYREAASGTLDKFESKFEHYITAVYNENDGYYHVNTIDGPLLLADLLSGSQWNPVRSLYEWSVKEPELFNINGVDYTEIIEEYAVYAAATTLGYATVTKPLADALKAITNKLGHIDNAANPDQWLELCVYYNTYGKDEKGNKLPELASPIKGLAPFDCFKLDASKGQGTITIDRIIQTLNGYLYEFIPAESGVYKIFSVNGTTSDGKVKNNDTNFSVFDENNKFLFGKDDRLRDFAIMVDNKDYNANFVSYHYYEAGKKYYLRPTYTDIFETGSFDIKWIKIGDSYNKFAAAAEQAFTFPDPDIEGQLEDNIISRGVSVTLNKDGYYYVDGSLADDKAVYFDAIYSNDIFNKTFKQMLHPGKGMGAFDFRYDDRNGLRINSDGYYLKKKYELDENGNKLEVIVNEKYVYTTDLVMVDNKPIKYEDLTAEVEKYVNDHMIKDEASPYYGLVKVDQTMARYLQMVMDKYTFEFVENSWLKLCYYIDYVGVNKA